jgi:hypothetical protein
MASRLQLGALCALLASTSGSDLSYPTPPNPFAKDAPKVVPPPPPLDGGAPRRPPGAGLTDAGPFGSLPSSGSSLDAGTAEGGLLPGGAAGFPASGDVLPGGGGLLPDGDISLPGGGDGASSRQGESVMPPGESPVPTGAAAHTPGASRPAVSGAPVVVKRGGFQLRPTLCLAALSAACVWTRPREASLIAALDAHYAKWGGGDDSPVELLDAGLATAASHDGLLWLGMLGRWMPLLPLSADAVSGWMEVVGDPQLIMLGLTACYLLSKLVGHGALAVSFRSLFGRLRLHSLATASFAPAGLVHWLHAIVVVVAASGGIDAAPSPAAELDAPLTILEGRGGLAKWWLAGGAASALSAVITQALLGRRSQPRSTVSGAAMAILLMRSAALPGVPIQVGDVSIAPLRAVVAHMVSRPAASLIYGVPSPAHTMYRPHARCSPCDRLSMRCPIACRRPARLASRSCSRTPVRR